ncbi:MAG: ABC transporter permease subunit [Chloroflexi bacterium]|nr:ABC transporter permease subunit [Chloroflexota bacterium]
MRLSLTYQGIPIWRHSRILSWTAQIVSGILVVAAVAFFFSNVTSAMVQRDIPFGFSFLNREYSTPISEHLLPYQESDTFAYAFLVAATNTLMVSVVGVILATTLGIIVGALQLSGNWVIGKVATVFVEVFRNVPLLVQLFFWYILLLGLPSVQQGGFVLFEAIYLNNNAGLSFPWPEGQQQPGLWLLCVVLAVVVGIVTKILLERREERTGRPSYPWLGASGVFIAGSCVAWLVWVAIGDAPYVMSVPHPEGRFGHPVGGYTISIELTALLVGLIIYTAAFIAEIVRGGLQSVSRGQSEASRSLGLGTMQTLRFVTFPQALRVIVPPLISQYLNLTKNSSLALAIGYADLTSVAKTMTQTAPAVTIFLIIMGIYLLYSLTYSLIGNLYNRHIQFTGG